MSSEAQLLMAVVLFYIYDSCQLLFINEGVIIRHGNRYTATINKNGLILLGKKLLIPNLLLPHQPIYRLPWESEKIEKTASIDLNADQPLYLWFAFPAYGMAISLFILTPAVYYISGVSENLLWCLGLIYYFSIVMGVELYFCRKPLELSNKKAWSLFFECLFCPPFAINIVRKLSLSRKIENDFVTVSFALLTQERWEGLREDLIIYIEREMEETDLEDRIIRLNESKKRILGMNK